MPDAPVTIFKFVPDAPVVNEDGAVDDLNSTKKYFLKLFIYKIFPPIYILLKYPLQIRKYSAFKEIQICVLV